MRIRDSLRWVVAVVAVGAAGLGLPSPAWAAQPGQPTIVTVSSGNGQATVEWTAPASNGGFPINGYTVITNGGSPVIATDGSARSAVVTGLINGNAYTFTVLATNTNGEHSDPSAASSPVTPSRVPDSPTGVTASPGDDQVTVSWSAPLNEGGAAITGYTVTANPGGLTSTVGAGTLSTTVAGLTNGIDYTLTVVATNIRGNSAPASSNVVTPEGRPAAPTNVAATAGNAQATVTWTPPSDTGGIPLTGFVITSSPATTTVNAAPGAMNTTVTGLTNGTAYTFSVVASNENGDSPPSTSGTVTPTDTASAPGAPTNVNASAGNQQATVTWTAPSSNGGSAITDYTVLSSTGIEKLVPGAASTSTTVTGLVNGTAVTFTVRATNAKGDSVASAASNSVTPTAPPTVPGAPTSVSGARGVGQITVSWTAPASNGGAAITGYKVTRNPGNVPTTVGNVLSTTISGLTNGTDYTFTVVAINSVGEGAASSASSPVAPWTVPGAPTGVNATAGQQQATVTWTTPASDGGRALTGYQVTAYNGATPVLPTTSVGVVNTATVSGLTGGVAYTFRVQARNLNGLSSESMPSVAVTPTAAPGGGGGTTPTTPPTTRTQPVAPPLDRSAPAPVDLETSAGTVELELELLSGAAQVTATVRSEPPVATGFRQLPTSFDITLTGATFGTATVCLPYRASEVESVGLQETNLGLFHFVDGRPFEITTSLDTTNNIVCGRTSSFSPFSIGQPRSERLSGGDRFATAAAISAANFQRGVPVVYVASGRSAYDGLAGGPLAAADRAPLLLVEPGSIPVSTATELARLQPDRIVILGGTLAVSNAVQTSLAQYGTVSRLQGGDRYLTAIAMSAHRQPGVPVVYLVTGNGFADALGAGALAAVENGVILLTQPDRLRDEVMTEIVRLQPRRIVIVGGHDAVRASVETAVEMRTGLMAERIEGADRYATAAALASRFAPGGTVFAATGFDYADALAGVPAAALSRAPVVLVRAGTLGAATETELARLAPTRLVVLGAVGVLSRPTESLLAGYLAG